MLAWCFIANTWLSDKGVSDKDYSRRGTFLRTLRKRTNSRNWTSWSSVAFALAVPSPAASFLQIPAWLLLIPSDLWSNVTFSVRPPRPPEVKPSVSLDLSYSTPLVPFSQAYITSINYILYLFTVLIVGPLLPIECKPPKNRDSFLICSCISST